MTDITFRAFSGINNLLPPERIRSLATQSDATCELVAASNVDIDNSGRISRRAGIEQKVAGAAHSLWSNGDLCVFVQGNRLMQLQPDFSTNVLAAGLIEDMPVAYVEAAGNIFWTNGLQSGSFVNSKGRPWGMPTPEAPFAFPIVGNLGSGDYQYAMTYRRTDGSESGAGMASRISLTDNSGLHVEWRIPQDPTVSEVVIYLSEPNGEQMYQAIIAPVADTAADITSAVLATPLATQWLDAPPAGQVLAHYRGRIYIAAGSVLYATVALGYEWVDMRDYVAFDDSAIRIVAAVESGLFVGTEKGIYFLGGTEFGEMTLVTQMQDVSAVMGSLAIVDGKDATGKDELSGKQLALFTTSAGIVLGMPDGSLVNLTSDRYRFVSGKRSAAIFRFQDKLNQYMVFVQKQ